MINTPVAKRDNEIKKQTGLAAMFFLSCLFLSSCSNNPGKNKEGNDISITVNNGEATNISGQMLHPCHWSYKVEQSAPGEAILISTAKIDSGWHLYSQNISDKGSPTIFTYDTSPDYKLIGGTEEGMSHKEYDEYLQIEILYFEKEAVFRQKIKVMSKKDFTITGTINHTACLTQCVTNEDDFSFKVKGNTTGD